MGRVTAHKQTTDATAYTTGYTYNLSGALNEETYPSGRVVKNVLNPNGDLSIVQSKKNSTAGYFNYAKNLTYNAAGAVTSMQLGNGKWESTQFNSRLQPTQIALGTTQTATDKLKLNFDYGTTTNNGNVLTQTITVPSGFTATQTYTYDALNRINDATETGTSGWKQTFLYDRYGNRNFDTSVAGRTTTIGSCATAVCNPAVSTTNNRLAIGQGYSYDNAGNTTIDAQSRTFVYDAENKQTSVSGTGGTIGQYSYDGDGKRVKKYVSASGETTVFVYDAAGKQVAEYSTIVYTGTNAKVAYTTNDHLGSPRIVTDANGAVISRKDFTAFGETVTSSQRTGGSTGNGYDPPGVRQDYTGYQKDGESGLEYAQARYYNPQHGRFTSVDPLTASATIRNPQSFNRYSYVLNSPYKFTDPLGLMGGVCSADNNNCNGDPNTGKSYHTQEGEDAYDARVHEMEVALRLQKKAQDASNRGDYDAMWNIIDNSNGLLDVQNTSTSVKILPGEGSVNSTNSQKTFFETLWDFHAGAGAAYVNPKTGKVPSDYKHQCAINMSVALQLAGVDMSSYSGITVDVPIGNNIYKAAISARSLGDWLFTFRNEHFKDVFTADNPNWNSKLTGTTDRLMNFIVGKRGIVIALDSWKDQKSGRIGDHMDLWNGQKMKREYVQNGLLFQGKTLFFIRLQ